MKISFYLKYSTVFGEQIYISGNNSILGNNDAQNPLLLTWLNEDFWFIAIDFPDDFDDIIQYKYVLKDINGMQIIDGEENRFIDLSKKRVSSYTVIDIWNTASDVRNVFFTTPFQKILLPPVTKIKLPANGKANHLFRVKAPFLKPGETVCLCGSTKNLKNWNSEEPIILKPENNWYVASVFLEENEWPASYKYGIYNIHEKRFIRFEDGPNRLIRKFENQVKELTIFQDGFVHLPAEYWKGSGICIPVFSLRTKKSFGIGEFSDIRLLIDWAKKTGFKLIQLLPVNDTSAHLNWRDSYPYAAISAFALHPIYINLEKVAGKQHAEIVKPFLKKKKALNELAEFDYEKVLKIKLQAMEALFEAQLDDFKDDAQYFRFFELNRDWLVPYAAFCYLRDKYKTSDSAQWKTHSQYDEAEIQKLASPTKNHYPKIQFYYYLQYHLHLQMKEVSDYAHQKKIVLKGDIPIGVYRYGCDAWVNPSLFNLDQQAGAPPDDFAVKGQNWGFPTYNWEEMSKDHYNWWRRRFDQMSTYFDAFRIDHILGFFRIWSIPVDSVEGIMGKFVPALPVHVSEFYERGISFDHDRYCLPYITEEILDQIFSDRKEEVKEYFLEEKDNGQYRLKEFVNTQVKVEKYFSETEDLGLKEGLFDLISNVILFPQPGSHNKEFHFRIGIDATSSYQYLEDHIKNVLWPLYIDYFYNRQNGFWKKEGMKKLPSLKRRTKMLVCGEDLGMVPPCVPEVMHELAILSLEVERMPKTTGREFFHPNDAPYLSVVTPSTHDMSTIRGWWEENRDQTQRFYNYMLGQYGQAPEHCEAWISKKIILQHLYSPAMWSIFLMSDLLGMSEKLRRKNADEERINYPSNSNHYWHYRLHLDMEDLLSADEFNEELLTYNSECGRIKPEQ